MYIFASKCLIPNVLPNRRGPSGHFICLSLTLSLKDFFASGFEGVELKLGDRTPCGNGLPTSRLSIINLIHPLKKFKHFKGLPAEKDVENWFRRLGARGALSRVECWKVKVLKFLKGRNLQTFLSFHLTLCRIQTHPRNFWNDCHRRSIARSFASSSTEAPRCL